MKIRMNLVLAGLLLGAAMPGAALSAPAIASVSQEPEAYAITPQAALRRELTYGIYQVIPHPETGAVYVASAQAIAGVSGGTVYRLDPETLQTTGLTHTDEKNFGLALDAAGKTLYTTNSLASAISAIDLETGAVRQRLKFTDRSADGTAYGPRQMALDASSGLLYVGGVGDPGVIWAVDASTLELRATIGDAGKWVTGLLVDSAQKRLYAANGSGEVLVIDTETHAIRERWTPGDGQEYLLLNLALDRDTHRLFVTDHSKAKTVLVIDTRNGRVIERLPVGDSMDILLNHARNELYISHREQGTLSVLDAGTYQTLKSYQLPVNPNSLALSADSQTLYVTVKTPFNKDYTASGPGSIVRIELAP